ncbi:hypothetical protein CEXT_787971 [Caerostris extrusa]|uniref:Uncharacterized protein n=1 Tax=Caerostris extrusa TaxID=172846 RepID=A0AAV4PHP7_CAEEX|nr:hypothetical protein CEXT_787971 [Caerostris extrusa]
MFIEEKDKAGKLALTNDITLFICLTTVTSEFMSSIGTLSFLCVARQPHTICISLRDIFWEPRVLILLRGHNIRNAVQTDAAMRRPRRQLIPGRIVNRLQNGHRL